MREAFVKAVVLTLLAFTSIAALAASTPASPKTYAQRLPNKDVAELADTVCGTRHGIKHDKINAWADKPKGARDIHATVACQPHAVTEHYTIYHQADCQRDEKWQCNASGTRLHAKLDTRQIDIDIRGYQPELAYSLINRIDKYRLPKGDAVLEAGTAQCTLLKGPSKELLDIKCDDKLIRLSYWCPQSSCPRIFWINGYFVPADAGGL